MEMLSIMHEADPRGSLLINGNPISAKQLTSLCGAPLRETVALLHELDAAAVFSRAENGTIFSRRMKRDDEKAALDKANGKSGGNPDLKGGLNPGLNGGVNPRDKAQSPESRCHKPEPKERTRAGALAAPWNDADRERFWAAFPNKIGKADAMKAFDKATTKVTPEVMFPALNRYANKNDDRPFCNPSTWLNQERWLDQPAVNNVKYRPSAQKTSGADAILAVATRKARELDWNDTMAGTAGEAEFALGSRFVEPGPCGNQRAPQRADRDNYGLEPVAERGGEGEVGSLDPNDDGIGGGQHV
ncbi:MAG: hypothetical protein H0V72_02715 [Bradyrhizobium sp.]|nr:hypothetical protein [Bradyrhizobium sp.]